MRAEYVCTLAPMPRLRISATSSMARRSCWLAPHWAMHVVYLPGGGSMALRKLGKIYN